MARNLLRERLKAQDACYGLWITMESPSLTEIAGACGMHWVCIDMEHGHLDFREVMEHIRAARGSQTTVLVRVPTIEEDKVKRVLDMGAHGVFLPLVRSREDLERGVRFGRYPPEGVRGVGGERAVTWGLEYEDYLHAANQETLIIPIIETQEAAENIDSILAVPGLEAIFLGPADLSASYGYLGKWEGPGVATRIIDILDRACRKGIASGVMSTSVEDGIRRRDQGFKMVGLGSDAGLLIRSISEAMDKFTKPAAELSIV
jgi:2-keto-3-deoxy-L-rhamnonate aldolase RhmA